MGEIYSNLRACAEAMQEMMLEIKIYEAHVHAIGENPINGTSGRDRDNRKARVCKLVLCARASDETRVSVLKEEIRRGAGGARYWLVHFSYRRALPKLYDIVAGQSQGDYFTWYLRRYNGGNFPKPGDGEYSPF